MLCWCCWLEEARSRLKQTVRSIHLEFRVRKESALPRDDSSHSWVWELGAGNLRAVISRFICQVGHQFV